MTSLKGAAVELSPAGTKVLCRVQAGENWASGYITDIVGDTLYLANGAMVDLSPLDGERARACLKVAKGNSIVWVAVIIVGLIIGVPALLAGVRGFIEGFTQSVTSDLTSSR